MASVGLPAYTIADGSIRDSQTVADAIKEAVVKAGIGGLEAAIAVCGRELIIKKVQIPEVPARDVHDVVMLEAEHHIPFAIDEVFIDHHTLGRSGGQMDVILVAVKKSKVNEYLASTWGIPVALARPFERIEVASAYAEEAAAMAPALAVAVGLGLRRSGDKEQSK